MILEFSREPDEISFVKVRYVRYAFYTVTASRDVSLRPNSKCSKSTRLDDGPFRDYIAKVGKYLIRRTLQGRPRRTKGEGH